MTPAHAFWSFAPLNTGTVRGVIVTDNIRGMRTRRSAIVVVALAVVVGVAAAFGAWHSDRGESAGTAGVAGLPAPSSGTLINFTFDWALDPSIAVVGDSNGSIERAYGITKLPTTLVIDKRGVVRHRWNGFALAAQLDFAIRPLVGRALVGPGPGH